MATAAARPREEGDEEGVSSSDGSTLSSTGRGARTAACWAKRRG